jgi:hypothetical protein
MQSYSNKLPVQPVRLTSQLMLVAARVLPAPVRLLRRGHGGVDAHPALRQGRRAQEGVSRVPGQGGAAQGLLPAHQPRLRRAGDLLPERHAHAGTVALYGCLSVWKRFHFKQFTFFK